MPIKTPKTLDKYIYYRDNKGLVVVKFGAIWCVPCKNIMPVFEKLQKEYTGIFIDLDIDNEEILEHEDCSDIRTVPTFKIFLDGELKRIVEGADSESLTKYIKRYGTKKINKKIETIKNKQKNKTKETVKTKE